MNNTGIHVYSEIGRLKKVLLHHPGKELENLMPEYLERLLFDDVPYLKVAQEEHDAFASILRGQGVEVVYLEDLVEEAVVNEEIRAELIREYVAEAGERPESEKQALVEYYSQLGTREMILQMMAGLRKTQLGSKSSFIDSQYPFAVDPMPNLYFTRDPFASIGNGVSIHKMRTVTRNRETLFAKFIFKYHPMYSNTPVWYDRTNEFSLEGGDILMLNEETVAVGISQRTDAKAAEALAERLLTETNYKQVLGFDIPKHRAFMHLDTVFTMVDYDKFTIHPNIMEDITVYVMEKGEDGKIKTTEETLSLEDILKKHLKLDKVTLIKCGGGDVIDAAREQWNDGSNTLAIAPGEVVVYSRNYVTNRLLEENGIKTYVMPSAELSRGRGGPRCMSMPLYRDRL